MSPAEKVTHLIENTSCIMRISTSPVLDQCIRFKPSHLQVPRRIALRSRYLLDDAFAIPILWKAMSDSKVRGEDREIAHLRAKESTETTNSLSTWFPKSEVTPLQASFDVVLAPPTVDNKPRTITFKDERTEGVWFATQAFLNFFGDSPHIPEVCFFEFVYAWIQSLTCFFVSSNKQFSNASPQMRRVSRQCRSPRHKSLAPYYIILEFVKCLGINTRSVR